jgi:hypothetical protein
VVDADRLPRPDGARGEAPQHEAAAGGEVDEPLAGLRRGEVQRGIDRRRLPVLLDAVATGEAVPGGDRRRVDPARDRAISADAAAGAAGGQSLPPPGSAI